MADFQNEWMKTKVELADPDSVKNYLLEWSLPI